MQSSGSTGRTRLSCIDFECMYGDVIVTLPGVARRGAELHAFFRQPKLGIRGSANFDRLVFKRLTLKFTALRPGYIPLARTYRYITMACTITL
jgi:hypothetical protein